MSRAKRSTLAAAWVFGAAAISIANAGEIELLVNGDFENGDFSGWVFTPDIRSEPLMSATVVPYEGSQAFRLNPGNSTAESIPRLGGSLRQDVQLLAGETYSVSAGLMAISDTGGGSNSDGGRIMVALDGVLLHEFNVLGIPGGATRTDSFSTVFTAADTGLASLDIRFVRGFRNTTPAIFHFLDDVSVIGVPEPHTACISLLAMQHAVAIGAAKPIRSRR